MALQDARAAGLLSACNESKPLADSVILLQHGRCYQQSTAALLVASHLRWPWPLTQVVFIIPRFLRDVIYGWIARNRYKWFGRRATCWLPSSNWQERFL